MITNQLKLMNKVVFLFILLITFQGLAQTYDEVEEIPSQKQPQPTNNLKAKKIQNQEIDLIIDDIVDEYLIVLEAALRKKLKEKLPDILK